MITTNLQFLLATLEKFKRAGKLNGPKYCPSLNSVGCAIGCHFTPEEQTFLDSYLEDDSIPGVYSLPSIMRLSPRRASLINSRFGERVSRTLMNEVQAFHDIAGSDKRDFKKFIEFLESKIASIREKKKRGKKAS